MLRAPRLGVAVSAANRRQASLDVSIDALARPSAVLARQKPTARQANVKPPLGSWSSHVESCTQNDLFWTCGGRYEDHNTAPQQSFETLRGLDSETGFRERPQNADRFFRHGKIGDWQNTLSHLEIDRIVKDLCPSYRNLVMQMTTARLGYYEDVPIGMELE